MRKDCGPNWHRPPWQLELEPRNLNAHELFDIGDAKCAADRDGLWDVAPAPVAACFSTRQYVWCHIKSLFLNAQHIPRLYILSISAPGIFSTKNRQPPFDSVHGPSGWFRVRGFIKMHGYFRGARRHGRTTRVADANSSRTRLGRSDLIGTRSNNRSIWFRR